MTHSVRAKVNLLPLLFPLSTLITGRRSYILNSVRIQLGCLAQLADDKVIRRAMKKLQEDTLKHRQRVNEQERKMEMAYQRQLVNNS